MSTSRTEIAAAANLADRFNLVRRIADDLAHELKNPLNAVVINLEVLRRQVRSGKVEVALERLDVCEEEVRRTANLLEYVLRLLRPDQPAAADFPVAGLLAEVGALASALAKVARRGFELRSGPDDLLVHGDREPLRFALLALCEAAVVRQPGADDAVAREAATDGGRPAEEFAATLEAALDGGEVLVTLSAPAAAAARLAVAVPVAARLLAETDTPLGVALDEGGCRVRIALPRAAA